MKAVLISCLILSIVSMTLGFPMHARFRHADAQEFVEGEYLIVLSETATADALAALTARYHAFKTFEIHTTFKAFHAKLTDEALQALLEEPLVQFIEPNIIFRTNNCPRRQGDVSWGQDRVTAPSANDLDDLLHYRADDGEDVYIYVIDTGIQITHDDFKPNRAVWGYNAVSGSTNTDLNGHGTHVASTSGGNHWGFAKNATLVAVKVLGDNGSGTNAGVIDGVNWAASQAQARKPKPSVGNMSLGGGLSTALDTAVNAAVNAGLIMVVAAGNDNRDCSLYSPARAANAITVGATTQGITPDGQQIDTRASFSNFGSCVDIFAPGQLITAAWIGSDSATRTISGTSMASPHVAGIAAVLVGQNPSWTMANVKATLFQDSQASIDLACNSNANCEKSPDRMLHRPDC